MIILCYPRCTTCRNAQKWLAAHDIAVDVRPIHEDNPTAEELARWHALSGLPLRRFFNTSGMRYKELKLKDRLSGMSEAEQLDLLASDGMLVKRPLLIGADFVLVGFREPEWAARLLP